MKSKQSEEVIQALLERYISRFGCPLVIHSDNGKEFTNQLSAKLLARLEVAHTFTPAYNPQSNNVERFHRTLRDHYWMWTARKEMDWARQLPCLELAYNSKVNEATGLTPFLVFLEWEAKLAADMVLPNQEEEFEHRGDAVTHFLKNMDKIYGYLKSKEEIRIRRNSMRYSNQPALNLRYIVWYLPSKMLYRIKPMIPAVCIQPSLCMWGG
ncbi:MAG: transposase family protein [Gammaproteobacteria bacterium]|nr:transposase family protein [Gammaproteobacteria bacterium]